MNKQNASKKRFGALDVLIILALAACVVTILLRYVLVQETTTSGRVELDNYNLTFEVYNIQDSSAKNFMDAGTNFYLEDSGELLGTLTENKTISDAEKFYEMPDGEIVLVKNTGAGDLYRVDVEASLNCKGIMNENGTFLLNGNKYIGVNEELTIYSKYLVITVKITDISKT